MSFLVGETNSLRRALRDSLEALNGRRTRTEELLDYELICDLCGVVRQIGLQIALLVSRDGRIRNAIVGSKERVYLPDLGRSRLDSSRLRRLRLLVFTPESLETMVEQPSESQIVERGAQKRIQAPGAIFAEQLLLSPFIAEDLLTDLEKLRLDAVCVFSSDAKGEPGPASLAYLNPDYLRGDGTGGSFSEDLAPRSISMRCVQEPRLFEANFAEFFSELDREFSQVGDKLYRTSDERVILVGAYTGSKIEAQYSMEELAELARTAGLEVADTLVQRRRSLDPKTLIGKGKIEEIVLHSLNLGVDLLIFDGELSPAQLRSISKITDLRIVDRSMLILDVFAQRAVSSEGRLQVELAQLKYSLPRLTETDTGLSRLTGGIGGRGPGETKLEIGRRRARDRIAKLERRIDKISRQRGLRREQRQKKEVPVIAIIGYTNAGKSTLLRALTKTEVFVEQQMFATLDPAIRRMRFPNDREVVFVDTVGFIRELPKELLAAFRATLEEVSEAEVLLHLVDATSRDLKRQIEIVESTLSSLGMSDKPSLLVLNKIDRLTALEVSMLSNSLDAMAVSASTREGIAELLFELQQKLGRNFL